MNSRAIYVFFCILLNIVCSRQMHSFIERAKRSLIYPEGASRLQIIAGFGIPVDWKPQTVIVGTVFKANYALPMNATQLYKPYTFYERKKRATTRWDLYNLLSQALQTRGFEGKACILRAICEMAHTPLDKNNGLFHELIYAVFTPTSTNEKVQVYSDGEYYAAQNVGKKNEDCERVFQDCGASLMDMFTVYDEILILGKHLL